MSVEKLWDELRVGVKCQSNVEIAGSPRNSFRASLGGKDADGRALVGQGSVKLTDPSQTANGFMRGPGSQSASDKTRTQEGNSPDRRLRSQMPC